MPLGMEVGLGPGDIMLNWDLDLFERGTEPPDLSAHVFCGQTVAYRSNC